jgi:hypothetical protein
MRAAVLSLVAIVAAGCTTSSAYAPYDAGAGPGKGPCPQECADSLCSSPSIPATPACKACLERAIAKGGPCETPVVSACQPDPDCQAEQRCVAFCQGTADGGADVGCASAGDLQACANCCATRHQAGYNTFFTALVACGCGR